MSLSSDESLLVDGEENRFKRSAKVFVLLVVAQSPSYGYEIRGRLEEFGYRRASSDPGALYRLLREMEAEGSIVSHWDVAGSGPARRYYKVTEAGQRHLEGGADRLTQQAQRIARFFTAYERFRAQSQAHAQPAGVAGPAGGS